MQGKSQDFGKSKFNDSIAVLGRIGLLFNSCNIAWLNRDYIQLFSLLRTLNREAYPTLSLQEREELSKVERECSVSFGELRRATNAPTEQERQYAIQTVLSRAYRPLDKYEKLLRELMTKHGMMLVEDDSDPSTSALR